MREKSTKQAGQKICAIRDCDGIPEGKTYTGEKNIGEDILCSGPEGKT